MRSLATRLVAIAALVGTLLPAGAASAQAQQECEWLAGDLHVHTSYSHDSYGGPEDDNTGPEEFYTFGWGVSEEGLIASSRGLDYVAITDHNDIRSQDEFDTIETQGVIPIPSYENSLSAHVQMHGATRLYDNGAKSLQDVERLASELRADGGVFQINHPSDGDWIDSYGTTFVPDAIEIWNIGVWAYEPPLPATNDHEYPLRFYDDYLSRGHHIAATGGSDSHWRSTTAVQGVGQPTTWVCSTERSAQGVLDGIDAGRTTISHQPPAYDATFAELRADGDGDGTFEAILGDSVRPASTVRALVNGAAGATLRLVTNAGVQETTVSAPEFSHDFALPPDAIFARAEVFYEDAQETRREQQQICTALEGLTQFFTSDPVAYCQARLAVVALTSPIYFENDQVDTSTSLVYDGDTSARVGAVADLAATLADAGGPVAGAPVEFQFRGTTYRAVTDEAGRAVASARISGPPGTFEVVSAYAGDAQRDPSGDTDTFEVTSGR